MPKPAEARSTGHSWQRPKEYPLRRQVIGTTDSALLLDELPGLLVYGENFDKP